MRRFFRLGGVVLLGGLLLAGPAYFWISDRAQVLRALYPLSALLATPTLSCSAKAPDWIAASSRFALWDNWAPAGQLAYVDPDGHLHECSYGWTDTPLTSGRVSSNTRFRYASMTKLLTAELVRRQIEHDRLALDDKVLPLLSVTAGPGSLQLEQLDVEHLLRHSAGFDRLKSVDSMVVRNKKPWCPYDAAALATTRVDFTPGERYAYHNLNYCLLGMLLEKADLDNRNFRELMNQEYSLTERGIRFIDGPYMEDEVAYDFRNSGFYGDNYWTYFDFQALSSSMGLSGSAVALASLISSLKESDGEFLLAQAPSESICDETVKRGCYGYGLFTYRPADETLRVHVQPGLLYGAPSLVIIDDQGGVMVWVGNGTRPSGSSTDAMLDHLYAALADHYGEQSRP